MTANRWFGILATVAVLVTASDGFAQHRKMSVGVFTATAVASTGNAASVVIDLEEALGDFALGCIGTGTGASMIVTYEAGGNDGTTFDTTTTSPSRTIHSDVGVAYLLQGFDLPLARKVKFRATGQGANPANATITCTFTYTARGSN